MAKMRIKRKRIRTAVSKGMAVFYVIFYVIEGTEGNVMSAI